MQHPNTKCLFYLDDITLTGAMKNSMLYKTFLTHDACRISIFVSILLSSASPVLILVPWKGGASDSDISRLEAANRLTIYIQLSLSLCLHGWQIHILIELGLVTFL